MSPSKRHPARRPGLILPCLFAACFALAILCAAEAHAAEYKMLGCSGTARDPFYTIENNTTSPQNPAGIFNFQNNCSGQGGDPPGGAAYLHIEENQASGNAGNGAKLAFNFDTPNQFVHFRSVSAYTREPVSFNEGWRSRLLTAGGSAGDHELFAIGGGLCDCGDQFRPTVDFAQHGWPFGGYLDFTHLTWEMVCMSYSGCDRSGVNAADLNGLSFVLSDEYRSAVNLLGTSEPFMSGAWVRGPQSISYNWTELGSGMRLERIKVDGATFSQIEHSCDTGWSPANGEYARTYQPCDTGADIKRSYPIETATLADGTHTIAACTEDFAQFQNLGGSGGESCDSRVVHTDNTAPGAPAGLNVVSANPARYLQHFGARFALPPNTGSPIVGVRYYVTDDRQGDKPVVPDTFVSGTEPTALSAIEGPAHPGSYTLHVALQDQVGFIGPYAAAPIPHDTTAPAAPQRLRVTGPTSSRRSARLDLAWQDITDAGSPINAAYYQPLDATGNALAPAKSVQGQSPEAIAGAEVPAGAAALRVWLEDEEGNVGAAATVEVPSDRLPPAAPQELSVTAPGISRSAQGFDVRWRNVTDEGSPIDAAHYEILAPDGSVAVGPRTVSGEGIEQIADLETPSARGSYTLRLWLSDAEGNVGAAASAPLAYECVGSQLSGARDLGLGLDQVAGTSSALAEGQGTTLSGRLRGGGDLSGAPVCVFARVVTDSERQFLGVAMTGKGGAFSFGLAGGPSREIIAVNRAGDREVSASTTIHTQAHPLLELGSKVVRGKGFATFIGSVPPPDNEGVLVVLQVRDSKDHWRTFRRYLTRDGGRFRLRYRFTRTARPTTYPVRAQFRGQPSYPYEAGNSATRYLRVIP